MVVDVLVEGALARLRDHLARRADLAVVLEARAAAQLAPEIGAEALHQHALGGGADRGERGRAQLGEPRHRLRPDPRHETGRGRREARARLLALSTTKPAGFSASEATFATSLFGPIPTEHTIPVALRISSTSRRIAARGESSPPTSR